MPQTGWAGAQRMSAGQPAPLEELGAMQPDPFDVKSPSVLDSPLKQAIQMLAQLLGAGGDPNLMPLGMVTPFVPKDPKRLSNVANQILREADILGFDTLPQARSAILSHPDWASRWEVPSEARPILEAWRKQYKLDNPQVPGMWEELQQQVRRKVFEEKATAESRVKLARQQLHRVK